MTTNGQLGNKQSADLFFAGAVILGNDSISINATNLMRLLHKHDGDLEKYKSWLHNHALDCRTKQLSVTNDNVYKRQKNLIPI